MIAWRYIDDSTKGTERKENKDRVWVKENSEQVLAVLFDGISSAKDANKGIDIATQCLEEDFSSIGISTNSRLSDLMFKINQKIVESALESPFTTYSAILIHKTSGKAQMSNMGDSRIYQVAPQYLKQLSEDDNLLHNKNVVTRYLGMIDLNRDEVTDFNFEIGDSRILLCSDGFYSMLEKNLGRFFEILNFKTTLNIKKSLKNEVKGKNFDDSSYLLIFN